MFRKILTLSVIAILFASPVSSLAQVNTSDDSDLFALPKDVPSFEELASSVDEEAKQARADRIAAEGRADAAEARADAARAKADAAEHAADILEVLANRNTHKPNDDSDLFALPTETLSFDELAASVAKEAAEARTDRIAAEGRVEAAEGRVEAAKAIADATEDLSN